jgi:F-type H+-transporting ATPase subunit b
MALQGFNILVLTAVLIFLLYKPVKQFMANRAERIKNDLESAGTANEKAHELKAHYESLIADIGKEKDRILSQAHVLAEEKSDQILVAAKQEAKYLLKKAEDQIKMAQENAAEENKKLIIELSTHMAAHFVRVSADNEFHNVYIDEALTDWSEGTWRA